MNSLGDKSRDHTDVQSLNLIASHTNHVTHGPKFDKRIRKMSELMINNPV